MWIWRTSIAKRQHVKGLFRAGAYVAALTLVFGGFQIRQARAELKNRTIDLGRQMMQLARATDHDVSKITFNGQPIWVGNSLSETTPKEILDRYEAYCSSNKAQAVKDWREIADKSDATIDKAFFSTGTMRSGGDEEGSVLCFTKTAVSKPSVREAVESFSKTGDLGAFGSLRYTYVMRTPRGKTHVLTAWTDDKFNMRDILPQEGTDSVGEDFAQIPRPPNTNRLVAARVEDTGFGVNTYEGTDGPDKVIAFYDQEMINAGWFGLDPQIEVDPQNVDPERPAKVRLYEKDGIVLTLASRPNGDDGKTTTGLGLAGQSTLEEFKGVHARNK